MVSGFNEWFLINPPKLFAKSKNFASSEYLSPLVVELLEVTVDIAAPYGHLLEEAEIRVNDKKISENHVRSKLRVHYRRCNMSL